MAFNHIPGASILRAFYSDWLARSIGIKRLGVLTVRIPAAGKKFTISATLDNHGFAAFFASFVCDIMRIWLNRLNLSFLIPNIIPGISAFGITAAGQKMTVFSDFNM